MAGLSSAVAKGALAQPSESTSADDAHPDDATTALVDDESIDVFRVHGRFSAITTRAIDLQQPPFKPLAELISTQHEYPMTNVTGTLVAIRAPKSYGPITIPGYHFHFITDDHQRGGHVLSCTVESGTVEFQRPTEWILWFPPRSKARPISK